MTLESIVPVNGVPLLNSSIPSMLPVASADVESVIKL